MIDDIHKQRITDVVNNLSPKEHAYWLELAKLMSLTDNGTIKREVAIEALSQDIADNIGSEFELNAMRHALAYIRRQHIATLNS